MLRIHQEQLCSTEIQTAKIHVKFTKIIYLSTFFSQSTHPVQDKQAKPSPYQKGCDNNSAISQINYFEGRKKEFKGVENDIRVFIIYLLKQTLSRHFPFIKRSNFPNTLRCSILQSEFLHNTCLLLNSGHRIRLCIPSSIA